MTRRPAAPIPAQPRPAAPSLRSRVQRHHDDGQRAGLVVALVPFPDGDDPLAVGRDPRGGEVESRGGQQNPALTAARVDDHDVLAQPPAAVVHGPSGDGHAPVRGQLESVLIQGPARLGSQVPRARRGPGPVRAGGRGRAPGVLARQHVEDQEPLLIRAEVVVPVPDQGGLVQDRRHAGIGTGLALLRVTSRPAGAGQHRRGEHGQSRAAGGGQLADATRRGHDAAGLPARGREQPQGPLGGRIRATPLLGARGRPRLRPGRRGDRRGVRLWPGDRTRGGGRLPAGGRAARAGARRGGAGRQENQRAVRQERRAVLPFRGAGQPGRRAPAPGVHPPDAGLERPPVRGEGRDGHGQPAAVRREPQPGQPVQGHVVVQVVEWGHCAFPPRLGGGPPGCGALRG